MPICAVGVNWAGAPSCSPDQRLAGAFFVRKRPRQYAPAKALPGSLASQVCGAPRTAAVCACAARHSGAAMPSHSRRNAAASPPPWSVEETDACFIMKDHAGQSLAYVYFEEEPGRYAAAKLLTGDEARRIAANVAKLPELLQHLASEEG